MKFILKILLAPVMLTLWLIECLCKLALKLSSVVFVLVSLLFIAAGEVYPKSRTNLRNGTVKPICISAKDTGR